MTCIAYKDGVLSADRQITHNGLISETDGKVFIIDDNTAMAFSGIVTMAECFKEWYQNGSIREDWTFSKEIPDSCCFIVMVMHIKDNKKIELTYWDDILLPLTLNPKIYHSYGSGRELALGAMYCGANTVDAVLAANHHLDNCGFGVSTVDGNRSKLVVKRIRK